jgi:hypothetical protein
MPKPVTGVKGGKNHGKVIFLPPRINSFMTQRPRGTRLSALLDETISQRVLAKRFKVAKSTIWFWRERLSKLKKEKPSLLEKAEKDFAFCKKVSELYYAKGAERVRRVYGLTKEATIGLLSALVFEGHITKSRIKFLESRTRALFEDKPTHMMTEREAVKIILKKLPIQSRKEAIFIFREATKGMKFKGDK